MKFQSKNLDIDHNPVAVFKNIVRTSRYCFLLETLADKYQPMSSSQSYIGCNPINVFYSKNNVLYVNQKEQTRSGAFSSLRNHLKKIPNDRSGYTGGLVGYFSHEGIQQFEPTLSFSYPRDFNDFEFAEYTDGIIFNPHRKPEYFYYQDDRSDSYLNIYSNPTTNLHISYMKSSKDIPQYIDMVTKAKDAITNGRVFQVVLANKFDYTFEGELFELYEELRKINPSPFMFF